MPITAFNSFTDGLDPNQRSRGHFITNVNLEDDRLWGALRGSCLVPALLL